MNKLAGSVSDADMERPPQGDYTDLGESSNGLSTLPGDNLSPETATIIASRRRQLQIS